MRPGGPRAARTPPERRRPRPPRRTVFRYPVAMRITWPASSALLLLAPLACSTIAPLDTEAGTTSDQGETSETAPTGGGDDTTLPNSTTSDPSTFPTTTADDTAASSTFPPDETTLGTGGSMTSEMESTGVDTTDTTDTTESSSSTGEPPPGCDDGLKNGDETDTDCGGGTCSPCDDEQACQDDPDCNSGVCTDMVCVAAACDDAVQNQDESDIDCGGTTCPQCLDGDSCVDSGDCESGVCDADICQAPTCDDNALNQDETAVDCGGSTCDPCGDGQSCVLPGDCTSGVCDGDVCAVPTCSDAVQNQDEAGVDCDGAVCAPCQLPGLILNEADYDNVGTDTAEFVEVYNNTGADVDLANIRLYVVNGSNNNVLTTVSLAPAGVLAQGQYLVVGPPDLVIAPGALKVDFAKAVDNLQNDTEGLALVDVGGPTVLDVLSYEGSITMANLPNLGATTLVEGAAFTGADSNTIQRSLARLPTGNDKNNAATDWILSKAPTAGSANAP